MRMTKYFDWSNYPYCIIVGGVKERIHQPMTLEQKERKKQRGREYGKWYREQNKLITTKTKQHEQHRIQ